MESTGRSQGDHREMAERTPQSTDPIERLALRRITHSGGAGVVNRTVWLRRSTDWGASWEPPLPQPHLGAGDLGQFIYDPKTDTILSLSPPPGPFPRGGPCPPRPGCVRPFSCMSKSTDAGSTWSRAEAVGCQHGNQTGGSTGEGQQGVALSSGDLVAPAGRALRPSGLVL